MGGDVEAALRRLEDRFDAIREIVSVQAFRRLRNLSYVLAALLAASVALNYVQLGRLRDTDEFQRQTAEFQNAQTDFNVAQAKVLRNMAFDFDEFMKTHAPNQPRSR